MNELLLESLVALTAFAVLWTLYYSMMRHKVETQPGSRFLLAGFILLFISSLIDITDNFPALNQYVLIGDTPTEAVIEKGIGSLIGLLFLAVGFHRWLPAVFELSLAKKNINKLNNKLGKLVDERTAELSQVNQQLRQEIAEREKAQNKLDKQMLHDPLTELPNRYALLEYLEHERLRSAAHPSHYAMFIIDLDQFKAVNDSLGHATGDKVIKAIGNRLAFNHRSEDFLGRLGGDEFVLVMSMNRDDPQSAALQTYNNATTLIELVAAQLKVDKHQFNLSASIGITVFNYGGSQSSEDILRQADIALYNAKEKGQGFFSFFQPEMQKKAQVRLKQSKELHDALANKELFLQYQPQVDKDGKFIGMEALLRWHHPINGIVDPSNFIALAEEIGIIDKLGRYIMHMACQQCNDLVSSFYPDNKLKVAINISPSHFLQDDFVDQVKGIIESYSMQNMQLVLEITEEVTIGDIDDVIKKMNQLRRLHVHFSLDDFGTGYSSLTYLKQLPIDTVKIDKSFIQELHENKDDASIVEAILTMTRALEIDVIAEGIENQSQYKFLADLHCQYYQGYFFGKPESVAALIENGDLIDKRVI
ncbi:EAL domain-containing protein [Psychrobium sp. MM17-31]|uniref:putative bifunctional diguanylate cyclase/phosphodiesterase n=1 Tax=Psychrobium sp. MM17-31 TaxID=2917758 RepID=UPI001EF5D556|nr:EAL domain-containing protein [Psychrobium sp. MM17-31]MCG7532714.1 EAL domain-containing protein [Psychrobium sp. MM17-31]